MSNFGFYPDAPNKIRYEGSEIVIKFEKTSPTTARISWTLPVNVASESAYNGIVIVIDNVAINQQRTVVNGTYYTGDPTVDVNLFAGDRIDSAMVVGAFYDNKTTTYIDITGIKDNTPYYVAGFAVDNVCQYHTEGVHSYSQKYGAEGTADTRGYQLVNLGVNGTDLTGLDPLTTYTFQMTVDGLYKTDYNTGNTIITVPGNIYAINVLGSNAVTFDDLINNINYQLAIINNPFQGPTPPNTNGYYYDTVNNKLYQWNGTTNDLLDPIFSPTDPTITAVGSYWFEQDTLTLYQWDGVVWQPISGIHYIKAPNQLTCDDFWFDGTTAYVWDTVIWKPLVTRIQETDPTGVPQLACNSYWFNETDNTLSYWKDYLGTCNTTDPVAGHWVNTTAMLWATDPRVAVVGQYWFNETNTTINAWNGTGWDVLTTAYAISETEPTLPAVGFTWYDPTTEELNVWDGTVWVLTDILVWVKDPTIPLVGELWWNTTTDELFTWDQLTSAWKQIVNFIISPIDPALPATMNVDDVWYIPSTQQMFRWDGSQWCVVAYINWATDPTIVTNGDYYYNTVDNKWYTWTGAVWAPIAYTTYDTNPSSPSAGEYWFNTSNNTLWMWNGLGWVGLLYSTTPLAPANGTLWYDTGSNALYTWNGAAWVSQIANAFVALNEGNLAFFSGSLGSLSTIWLVDGTYVSPPFPYGLFGSLTPTGKIQPPVNGADGVSDYPTWSLEGIGTDGSSDERRDMAENILLELGYPTVQVELTKEQLDFCIDQALQVIRRSSSTGYERVYFFMDLVPGQQHYIMSDKNVGFHKIVSVMGLHRMSSAFLGTAEGQGVYGQIVLQHLYQMGTFDLVSYHIINEYIELMEKLFAANLMYKWNERKRMLSIQQNLWRKERILVDATIERTEQDMLGDRLLNNWIQTWATAEARMILAEIRGKFQGLPGAGGGIALNASDLRLQANADFEKCWQELDDFIATDIEEYGLGSTIIMG